MNVKKITQFILILIDAFITFVFIGIGFQGAGLADGVNHANNWMLILGPLLFTTLVVLWIIGRSKKQAEQAFWFLGIAYLPLLIFLILIFPST